MNLRRPPVKARYSNQTQLVRNGMSRGGIRCVALVIGVVFLFMLGAGCAKLATEEDLKNLEKQKQAALSAEEKVEQLKREKAELEQIKAEKELELQEVLAEKAQIREELGLPPEEEPVEEAGEPAPEAEGTLAEPGSAEAESAEEAVEQQPEEIINPEMLQEQESTGEIAPEEGGSE